MTGPEQEQQVGKLVFQRQQLKRHIACLEAKLGGWETDLGNLSNALQRAREGSLRLGQKIGEEKTFAVASFDSDKTLDYLITQIRHRDGMAYPDFEEISQALLDIQQARMDLAQVKSQLKDCGVD